MQRLFITFCLVKSTLVFRCSSYKIFFFVFQLNGMDLDQLHELLEGQDSDEHTSPEPQFQQESPSFLQDEAASLSPISVSGSASFNSALILSKKSNGQRSRMKQGDYERLPDEIKRLRKLLQNRISAADARARRKTKLQEQKEYCEHLEASNEALQIKKRRMERMKLILQQAIERKRMLGS